MAQEQSSTISIVSYIGISEPTSCGYCKSTARAEEKILNKSSSQSIVETRNTEDEDEAGNSIAFGCTAHYLTFESFNQLIDLGWTRSGRYLYKPVMDKTCCPQYSIRLDVDKFYLSKTQKNVLKTMLDFLKFDKRKSKLKAIQCLNYKLLGGQHHKFFSESAAKNGQEEEISKPLKNRENKKKSIRRKRKEALLISKGIDLNQYKLERSKKEEYRRRTIESYLEPYETFWKHKLEIKLVNQLSEEFEQYFEEEFAIYCKYQITIHGDNLNSLTAKRFRQFLASSPLRHKKSQYNGVLGSFHQLYFIDGKIAAVGVIDILPRCLSSKYFFYDPLYDFLSLGTYSALREISFVKELSKSQPELHYYYMGYYLFNCPKMRYKGRFRPSELLCNRCFRWVPLQICEQILSDHCGKYQTFHPSNEDESAEDQLSPIEINRIKCLIDGSVCLFSEANQIKKKQNIEEMQEKLKNFAIFAGAIAYDIVVQI